MLIALLFQSFVFITGFLMPFQNAKPKAGLYCSMLNKCRETTALEMPDREHTFVLKVSEIVCSLLLLMFRCVCSTIKYHYGESNKKDDFIICVIYD